MQFLDRTGVGTLWSMCKEKFALAGHTHNYAGSGSPGGSANSAIGVVDYNQTYKTIQIGYSGTGITGDQIRYIAGYTYGSGNVNAKIKNVSKDALKSWLGLGSVVSDSGNIVSINVCKNHNNTEYNVEGIIINNYTVDAKTIKFPSDAGTFALLSDIPNVSNLCKFNFISNISECVNGRINFLFKDSNNYVDLSFLNNLEEGTILLIYCTCSGFQITNNSTVWYYNGLAEGACSTEYIDKAKLVLAFFYDTYTYVSTFSH